MKKYCVKKSMTLVAMLLLASCSGQAVVENDSEVSAPVPAIVEGSSDTVTAPAAAPDTVSQPTYTLAPRSEADFVKVPAQIAASPSPTPDVISRPALTAVSHTGVSFYAPAAPAADPRYQYCMASLGQCQDRIPADAYKVEWLRACNEGFDHCMVDESCEAKLSACGYSGKNVWECGREKKECDCETTRLKCYSESGEGSACYYDYNSCMI